MFEPVLSDIEYTALAHRIASTYRHRSDPKSVAYTFLAGTLAQFVSEVEKAVLEKLAEEQEPVGTLLRFDVGMGSKESWTVKWEEKPLPPNGAQLYASRKKQMIDEVMKETP